MPRLLLLLLFIPATFYGQQVDTINSNEAALALVKKVNGTLREEKIILSGEFWHFRDSMAPELRAISYYEKADFDNNGYTDLLFNGCQECIYNGDNYIQPPIVILAFGKDSFLLKNLSCRNFPIFQLANMVQVNGQPMIRINHAGIATDSATGKNFAVKSLDTLVYVADEFIESASFTKKTIKSISLTFSAIGLPGVDSSTFIITLTRDTAWLTRQVIRYTDTDFSTTLNEYRGNTDATVWDRLTELLNYTDFSRLKSHYEVSWRHAAYGFLEVTYDDGKLLQIRDIGLSGTYGLRYIYEALWQKANVFNGILISQKNGMLDWP